MIAARGTVCHRHSYKEKSSLNLSFNSTAVVGERHIPRELALLFGSNGKDHSRCGGYVKRSPVATKSCAALQAGTTSTVGRIREFEREVIDLSDEVVDVRITSLRPCLMIFI